MPADKRNDELETLSQKIALLEKLGFPDNWNYEQILSTMNHPATLCFQYTKNSEMLVFPASIVSKGCDMIGYGIFQLTDPQDPVECLRLCVHPENRRQGLAGLILESFQKYYFDKFHTYARMILEVSEKNTPALNFYQKTGFKLFHKRKKYYGKDDALLMEWLINDDP